jgi:predicted nucleotidyltransferase
MTAGPETPRTVRQSEFEHHVAEELSKLPGVLAVALGGSRARGTHRADSDWDFAIYYRRAFDPNTLRAKGWQGEVFDIGAWGGGVMNGGAWLTIDGRRVDVHYRDLDEVEHWCREAREGRFRKEHLLFYVAGIPTYVVMAELALNHVLCGSLPVPEYPDPLSRSASVRWHDDAQSSLSYAMRALGDRGDVTVAFANAVRAVLEEAHSRMAARKQWVLNEKGLADAAGLAEASQLLLVARTFEELNSVLAQLEDRLSPSEG